MFDYDLAIIGLGPAGSMLARLAGNRRIIAIDKKDLSGGPGFAKPCGGLLAGDAQKSLSRFNLSLPKDVLVDPQIFAVRTLDLKSGLCRHYQRFYINMDRRRFDLWLASLIPEGVRVIDRAVCTDISRRDGGFVITCSRDGKTESFTARYVAGADGANSAVRRFLFPKFKPRSYLSIQEWFPESHHRPLYSSWFDSRLTNSYAWGLSKDGHFIVGGAFPVRGGKERFGELKKRLGENGYVLGEAVKREACLVLRPRGFLPRPGMDDAFLLGEAAGFVSPSSLEGISYALDSARELAFALQDANPVKSYCRRTIKIRMKLAMKNVKSIFMYCHPLRYAVMKSGVKSIRINSG